MPNTSRSLFYVKEFLDPNAYVIKYLRNVTDFGNVLVRYKRLYTLFGEIEYILLISSSSDL